MCRSRTGSAFVVIPAASAEVHADFDQTGALDGSAAEQQKRIIRPGAILLANLDIDDSLPAHTAGDPLPDLPPARDAMDITVNGGNDADELIDVHVQTPSAGTVAAGHVRVQVDAADAQRIRVFDTDQSPAVFVIGDDAAGGTNTSHDISVTGGTSWRVGFKVEAITLPGDSTLRAPGALVPNPPRPGAHGLGTSSADADDPANTADRTRPIYTARVPSDVWVELRHFPGGVEDPSLLQVGLFTIAPFMVLSNLQPVEKVYIAYFAGDSFNTSNHETVFDVAEALAVAFGGNVHVPADSATDFDPSRPANFSGAGAARPATDRLYIIDGGLYNDQWVQDEFEIGYCSAPHGWRNMVLHCKRGGDLADFVQRELCEADLGLYTGIFTGGGNSPNFGGNLEVSPPVDTDTPTQGSGAAGPAIPAQPEAPFGKVLVGDTPTRAVHGHFRDFLNAQKVQPVVPFDLSWLAVSHIDEIMSFVPATSGKGFKFLIASVYMAHKLLDAAARIPAARRTNLFRGKAWGGGIPSVARGSVDASISVEQLRSRARAANERIRTSILIPIEERFKATLDLAREDIIRIPVYFDAKPPTVPTAAFTPGMVNLLVVDTHVLVPKPFGPRMPAADVETILRDKAKLTTVSAARLTPLVGHHHWATRGHRIADIAALFGVAEADIMGHANNAGLAAQVTGGALDVDRKRIWIPEDNVDLFEAYTQIALEDIGLTVHFIDDWHTYHRLDGEVHCGTNVRRTPPEADGAYSGPYWWESYEDML